MMSQRDTRGKAAFKPFPSGSLTHPGMTELLRLIGTNSIRAADVSQVEVGTNHNMLNTLIHHQPTKGRQAKFSMEFCMAMFCSMARRIRRSSQTRWQTVPTFRRCSGECVFTQILRPKKPAMTR